MKNKILTSVWFVLAALASSFATAATVTNSEAFGVYDQTADAELVLGTSGRVNDVIIQFSSAAKEVDKASGSTPASEIVLRLPDGVNFASAPTFAVTAGSSTSSVSLLDSAGDPTLTDALVTMSDTNNDGENDRAVVTVASPNVFGNATNGDSITVTVRVKAGTDAVKDIGTKQMSVIITGQLPAKTDIVNVVKSTATRVLSAKSTILPTVSIDGSGVGGSQTVAVSKFNLIIPAGTTNSLTVTLKPEGNGILHAVTSTLKISNILSPVNVPLTSSIGGSLLTARQFNYYAGIQGVNDTPTITLTVQNAPTINGVAGFPDPVVVEMQVDYMAVTKTTAAKAGEYGFAVAGTAGIKGSAKLLKVAPTGVDSSVSGKLTKLVRGADQAQTLPSIVIKENFANDTLATTSTVTLKAGTGLTFLASTASVSFSDNGASFVGGSTLTTTVLELALSDTGGTTKTITIKGLKAKSTATAGRTLSLTIIAGNQTKVLEVANGVDRGTTSVEYLEKGTGAKAKVITKKPVGVKGTASAKVTLKESTYGAITIENAVSGTTSTIPAYIRFAASNAKVTGVTVSNADYTGGTAPTFGTCKVESKGASTVICPITAESSGAFLPGTATVTANVTFKADGAVGDSITLTLDGNAGVSGSVEVADIVVATEASASVVPQVTIGSANAQKLAPITIKQSFTGSTSRGFFRLLAPAGVKFANPGNITFAGIGTGVSATVTASTFATNDTLVIYSESTPSITFTPEAIISDEVAAGDVLVDIIDGNLSGEYNAGVTEESVNAAYATAEITALDAGEALTIGANYSATNTREGGVGDITAASSAASIATVAVDGDTITVTGVAAGVATITVTDSLGGTDSFAVTVTEAELTEAKAGKTLSGDDLPTGTAFTAGASSDGGATQGTEFTTADDVEIVATVTVGDDIVGEAGAIHVALMAKTDDGTTFSYLDEDGKWADWDITGLPGVHIDAEELAASYNVSVYSGKFAAGTYRIALAYSSDGEVYYTGKAITITITE